MTTKSSCFKRENVCHSVCTPSFSISVYVLHSECSVENTNNLRKIAPALNYYKIEKIIVGIREIK